MGYSNLNFYIGNLMKLLDTLLVQRLDPALVWMRSQAPLPVSEPLPPVPPEVVPPLPDMPNEIPPEIREPDLPGVHVPITDNPDFPTPTRHQYQGINHV